MTKAQAYRAMFTFLDRRFQQFPSDYLGQLLGELTLAEDGRPMDPATIAEWNKAVEIAVQD